MNTRKGVKVKGNGRSVRLFRGHEETILFTVMCQSFVTREQLVERMWPDPDDEPNYSWEIVGVRVWSLNQKIAPLGWRVVGRANFGWRLERLEQFNEMRQAA